MTAHPTSLPPRSRPTSDPRRSIPAKWFHTAASLLLAALTLWGFHHFYLEGRSYPGRDITPPIRGLVIVHGISMALWILLFLLQPFLVAINKKRAHMTIGRVGAVLAGTIFVLGMFIAVYSTRVAPPDNVLWGMNRHQFMAVPFFVALLFALYVGVAVCLRRKPAIHRAMMLTGTFAAMSAAISRIDVLSNLYVGTTWERYFGPFFVTQALMCVLLIVRCIVTRSIDRWLTFGFLSLTAAFAFVMWFARTDAWNSFATTLAP